MGKTYSYRTKRRRIQRELEYLNHDALDVFKETTACSSPCLDLIAPIPDYLPTDRINLSEIVNNLQDPCVSISRLEVSSDLENNESLESVDTSEKSLKLGSERAIKHYNKQLSGEEKREENIKHALGQWAVESNVSQITVNKLLKILKFKAQLTFLTQDCRTLLHTGSNRVMNIKVMKSGLYYHFGLVNGIKRYSSTCVLDKHIKIAVGIDGLPISKSSTAAFWPILAYIMPHKQYVFPIGLYYGSDKPEDSNAFLSDFITEVLGLFDEIVINNESKKITIEVFSCDVPAKSYVLRIKGHSGFFSCTRCTIEGEYVHNRVCFPYDENGITKRNHEDYLNMVDEEHHVSPIISCLVLIPGIDIVNIFSLDYMHLVCLGIMCKLLNHWLTTMGPSSVRLPSWKVKTISDRLAQLKICITNDFSRKPRSLKYVRLFKATELRQLLLYTGPVVFENIISDDCYNHFLTLSVAMRILLSSDLNKYIDYARKLLEYFVKTFQQIYGSHLVSHNVHSLLHLADDYDKFGNLDNCSAFPFENYMKTLKKMIRKHEKPLQQVVRRYEELCDVQITKSNKCREFNFSIKEPDCFFSVKSGHIIQITDFNLSTGCIFGRSFKEQSDMYKIPLKSSNLGILIVKDLSVDIKQWKISSIEKK
ncbi:Uncharacterized protein FWK35_00038752, partial [Aphis craccivora]